MYQYIIREHPGQRGHFIETPWGYPVAFYWTRWAAKRNLKRRNAWLRGLQP
jgi:hypothetical protein